MANVGRTSKDMNKSTVIILLLAFGLVTSNLWWAYQSLDAGISYTYQDDSLRSSNEALQQSLAVIKALSSPLATRDSVLAAATEGALAPGESFEKEGYIWVGSIGLKFSREGRLIEVVPSWSPFP
jgi:hypothetical protein